MPDVKRSWLVRYGIAVEMVAAAFLITSTFTLLHARDPFAFFYLAVVISALYGGRRAGLLAMALSVIAIGYFLRLSSSSLSIGLQGALLICVFVFVSIVLTWLTEKVKRAEVSARLSNTQLT